jgi:hypothetical protein
MSASSSTSTYGAVDGAPMGWGKEAEAPVTVATPRPPPNRSRLTSKASR